MSEDPQGSRRESGFGLDITGTTATSVASRPDM
jgi:hypothetical protein